MHAHYLQDGNKKKITRDLISTILTRKPKMSSFLEWQELKIVYKRYASLYFCCAIEVYDLLMYYRLPVYIYLKSQTKVFRNNAANLYYLLYIDKIDLLINLSINSYLKFYIHLQIKIFSFRILFFYIFFNHYFL